MSDLSFETLPVLDEPALDELREMLGEALAEITDSFVQGLAAEVQAVEAALGQGAAALKAAAHSLKGSSGNMGARRLSGLAAAIERAAIEGRLADGAALVPQLQPLADLTRQALAAYMARP